MTPDPLYEQIGPRFREWMESGAYLESPFFTQRAPRKRLTMVEVADEVADHYKFNREQLFTHHRNRIFAYPRFIAMLLISEHCLNKSYPVIGEFFGFDHTSIIHGVKRAKQLLEIDAELNKDYTAIKARL